ncbi:MAG: plasmid pRiA4b ORF-3 family protein [Planctomycetia bacterium]
MIPDDEDDEDRDSFPLDIKSIGSAHFELSLERIRETGRHYPLELTLIERKSLLKCTHPGARVRKKLEQAGQGTQVISFTWKEVKNLFDETSLAAAQFGRPHGQQLTVIFARLLEFIRDEIVRAEKPAAAKSVARPVKADTVYQFKITLLGSKPPVWRRIQIQDGTLSELHGLIQAAMGWTDSHLHEFRIQGQTYGDPKMLSLGFEDFNGVDSTKTDISQILPGTSKPFSFKYIYDFGDSWEHEILLEKSLTVKPQIQYPRCLEGKRACPPEDCGGVWGYADSLKALSNPNHEEHENIVEYFGSRFNSQHFDAEKASKAMQGVQAVKGKRAKK